MEADTDVERDFIVASVTTALPGTAVEVIRHFSSGFHARNGGGDRIETDGDLPVLGVGPSPDPPEAAAVGATDSRDRRPAQTVFGAGVALVRCLLFLVAAVAVFVAPELLLRLTHTEVDLAQVLTQRCRSSRPSWSSSRWSSWASAWPPSSGATGRACG